MAFALPRFSLQTITDIKRGIRIVNSSGVILPVIFMEDREDCNWEIPQHPVDSNMKISDTVWSTPAHLSLQGYVSVNRYSYMLQMIDTALKRGELWTVYYMGGVYSDMTFVSLSKTSNSENVTGYKVQIDMQQLPLVKPVTTAITAEISRLTKDADTQNMGQQQADKKDNRTLAKMALQLFTGSGG